MLPVSASLEQIKTPCIATPKIDGVRATVRQMDDGIFVLSRNGKKIPNQSIQYFLARPEYLNFDGEIVAGEATGNEVFKRSQSFCNTIDPDLSIKFTFFVFDLYGRKDSIMQIPNDHRSPLVQPIPTTWCDDYAVLKKYHDYALSRGYEGIVTRTVEPAAYKEGRSTLKEQLMIRVKPHCSGTATIIDVEEAFQNTEIKISETTGLQSRGLKKENLIGKNTLGAFVVYDKELDKTFKIGSMRLTSQEKLNLWARKEHLHGLLVEYNYKELTHLGTPREPVFVAFRAENTLDA
jgi:DNA ligase 1